MPGDIRPTVLLDHLHGLRIGHVTGNYQNLAYQAWPKIFESGDCFRCVHLGAAEIQKNRVKAPLFDYGQRLAGTRDNVAFTSQSCQQDAEDVADGRFILDDENGAKLVTLVQIILGKAEKHPALTRASSFAHRAEPIEINPLINLAVKSIKVMFPQREVIRIHVTPAACHSERSDESRQLPT